MEICHTLNPRTVSDSFPSPSSSRFPLGHKIFCQLDLCSLIIAQVSRHSFVHDVIGALHFIDQTLEVEIVQHVSVPLAGIWQNWVNSVIWNVSIPVHRWLRYALAKFYAAKRSLPEFQLPKSPLVLLSIGVLIRPTIFIS